MQHTADLPLATPSRLALIAMLVSLTAVVLPLTARASHPARSGPSAIARVRAIQNGLTVQPPRRKPAAGHTNQSLYQAYFLSTNARQRASLRFGDGTFLHINQRTDLVLKNPHVTYVQQGEVDEILQPGTVHRIQTASCIAAAIGTEFDIREVKFRLPEKKHGKKKTKKGRVESKTIIVVVEGSLVVETAKGNVTVKTNQQTTVIPGEKAKKPVPVEGKRAVDWTHSLPKPPARKDNLALDANGGLVIAASSTSTAGQGLSPWDKRYANDGTLDHGWASAPDQSRKQWIKLTFKNRSVYSIAGVVIDPSGTHGLPPGDQTKDFQVWASLTTPDNSSFALVYKGQLRQVNQRSEDPSSLLERFVFPQPVAARYLKIVAVDNYGGDRDALAEVEAISAPSPMTSPPTPTPRPRPTATSTEVPTPTETPTVVPTPTSTATSVPTFTPSPTATATSTPTPTATPTLTPVPPSGFITFVPPGPGPTATPTPCLVPPCY